jgi:putative addiction module killer protein
VRSLLISSLLLLTASNANAVTPQCLVGQVRDALVAESKTDDSGNQTPSPGLKSDAYHPDQVEKRQEAFAKEYGSQETVQPRPVREFVGANHKNYYRNWYDSLDHSVQKRIDVKIDRVKAGDLNGMKLVRAGIRFFYIGGGVRIFFTQEGKDVVLLTAGNKATQDKDIVLAEKLYGEFHGAKSP